jgi:glycerophosphoryl diester phosphodiesterase
LSSTCPEPVRGGRRRTRIIAHRGASGYLPEHTTAAKILAYGLGADLLEQDLVATRDHELVVLHDIYLDHVSDVALRFPDRRREDGHYYVVDFTRAELAELSLTERRRTDASGLQFPGRFPFASPEFRVVGLSDEIRLIAGLNRSTGRSVGIYPEIKQPDWHAAAGIDLTRLVHETLMRSRELLTGPVFIQSFDRPSLLRLRDQFGTPWPLVQLLDHDKATALAGDRRALQEIRAVTNAIGLPYDVLLSVVNARIESSPLARLLTEQGLAVHPYTLRRDTASRSGIAYFDALRFLIEELAVDALFCDFPDDAIAIRDGNAV